MLPKKGFFIKKIEVFNRLKEKFMQDKAIIFAYIFGSYATDNINPLSDIDIAVFLDTEIINDLFEKKLKLIGIIQEALLTDDFDLVILNEASLSLAFHVIENKKLLFSRDERQRILYEARIYLLYSEAEYLRKKAHDKLFRDYGIK